MKYAIIVAGGSGSRMKSDIPKQFIEIGGFPILWHTISRFKKADPAIEIIVVLPESQIDYWQKRIESIPNADNHTIVNGGATRFQSSLNGLSVISGNDGLVAIHDGVRPFIFPEIIEKSYQMAAQKGSSVVCVPLKDSVREVTESTQNKAIDRSKLRLIQTPQTFRLDILKKAFAQKESPLFTDDASVVEAAGFPISLLEGAYENIKITTPEDLLWAEILLKSKMFD
jgi:2-C-methyl-D-erythritol 4-phosphate cytidylyltransferase